MPNRREVTSGRQPQGASEIQPWTVTTTAWGSTPTSPSVVAYDITDGSRLLVSGSVLSGSPSVSGDIITTPCILSLSPGHLYRFDVGFQTGGKTLWAYFVLEGEH